MIQEIKECIEQQLQKLILAIEQENKICIGQLMPKQKLVLQQKVHECIEQWTSKLKLVTQIIKECNGLMPKLNLATDQQKVNNKCIEQLTRELKLVTKRAIKAIKECIGQLMQKLKMAIQQEIFMQLAKNNRTNGRFSDIVHQMDNESIHNSHESLLSDSFHSLAHFIEKVIDLYIQPEPVIALVDKESVEEQTKNASEAIYHPINLVDESEFELFKNYLLNKHDMAYTIVTGHKVTNSFFLEMAQSQKWITTQHVQVILAMLVRRRSEFYSQQRCVFLDPWLTNLLTNEYEAFKKAEKKEEFLWRSNIESLLIGIKDVDVVYIPMIWNNCHWVGLVIDIGKSAIEILDPLVDINPCEKVEKIVAPIVEMVPYLVKKFWPSTMTENMSLDPYKWQRTQEIYQSKRSEDFGIVAIKFMEMHAFGMRHEEMKAISNNEVDSFRKKYAMDTFKEFVGE